MQDDEKRWQRHASCYGVTEQFYGNVFPEANYDESDPTEVNEEALATAKGICAVCPVRRQCFGVVMDDEDGMAAANRYGVAAYMTPGQRWSAEKRKAIVCKCGEFYDPLEVVTGHLVCAICGRERTVPPIPEHGDQWNKRHTLLARRVVAWLVETTAVGDPVPLPTPQARAFEVRTADMVRVYEALVSDGTIERDGKRYKRSSNPASHQTWEPQHLITEEDKWQAA